MELLLLQNAILTTDTRNMVTFQLTNIASMRTKIAEPTSIEVTNDEVAHIIQLSKMSEYDRTEEVEAK